MGTLPSNASMNFYPNNKANSYKVQLPKTLDLDGEYEVDLVSIQYPYNWPNYTEENVAVIGRLASGEATGFKENCERYRRHYKDDPAMMKLEKIVQEYISDNKIVPTDYRLLKVPTGYYKNAGELAAYFCKLLSTGPSEQNCSISSTYDAITKMINIKLQNFSWIFPLSLGQNLLKSLGAETTAVKDNVFMFDRRYDLIHQANLENLSTMYIYCDVIKYQIVGDTQAPLLATLPVQGAPTEQIYWGFNPPYYIPVNQKTITSIEIKICTDTGEVIPFDITGRVVCNLHFRRDRTPW